MNLNLHYKQGRPRHALHKFLLVMKLVIILITTAILQVSAGTYAQTITLNRTNVPLEKVMKEIRQQTGYDFFYDLKLIKNAKHVNINVKNASLDEVLDKCFAGQSLTYKIGDKVVMIKEKAPSFLDKVVQVFQSIDVKGRVVDEKGNPLPGASIKVKGTDVTAISDASGAFFLAAVDEKAVLVISFIGYEVKEVNVGQDLGDVALSIAVGELNEVEVSTGYQTLNKERATGAFVQISNSLINRSVGTNILERLDGITSSLIFPKSSNIGAPRSSIEIRGRSTLFSSAEPLVILDNFPYEGEYNNINPNDVESITVLTDAAAASIWGARAGNGVIVITTKKGKLNTKPQVNFTGIVNIGDKPDLYYTPRLTSEQYLEVERFLFDRGAFNTIINNGYGALSPAVELMLANRNGTLNATDYAAGIERLKGMDSRVQQLKYQFRTSVNQQYQASVSGGGTNQKYFLSAGYDKNLNSDVNSNNDRVTLNANNTYFLLNNKLEINAGIILTAAKNQGLGVGVGFNYPYTQIADENGNPLVVANVLRPSYATTAGNGKLLDWLYCPLDEINNRYSTLTSTLMDYRINTSLSYKILKGLKASAYYSYSRGNSESRKLDKVESYYARNEINKLAQINPATGAVFNPLPVGGILETMSSNIVSHNGRFQLNYSHEWKRHEINLLSGTEIRTTDNPGVGGNIFYGYNPDNSTNRNAAVNTNVDYPLFYGSSTSRLVFQPNIFENNNRNLSYYFNSSYSFDAKYIASISVRRDESNLFGVSTNQKGVPLWSAGVAWNVDKEAFYSFDLLTKLKLRASYGYTGNVNNNISAYLTADSQNNSPYGLVVSNIINPPNPSLTWEKVKNLNFGLDFSIKKDIVNGSIDVWSKAGVDLIGNSPIAPQTGLLQFTGNTANTLTKGLDVQLNSVNINKKIKWLTTFIYSYQRSEVTEYKVSNGSNFNVVSSNYNNPLKGYPFYALFSFKYAGLDATGNPQAILNGAPSINYAGVRNSVNRNELTYSGSAVPTSFGSLRNTIIYKGIDFSFNVTYKLGYYFRRNSLNNSTLYATAPTFTMSDYESRWQKPGDEAITNVPSLIYPTTAARTSIYQYSDVLVEKGDHVRLRDIRLGYTFNKTKYLPVRNLNIFCYVNNLGILWKANHKNIDPDAVTGLPAIRSVAFGIRMDL